MLQRQRSGSVLCPSCGKLVGVNDEQCYYCGRKKPGMWGFAAAFNRFGQGLGFQQAVIGGTFLLYLATLVASSSIQNSGLSLLAPATRALIDFGASGAGPVFLADRWWTVLSAGWLHGGFLHIFFNAMWIRQLAPQTAELFGPGRMVILYTLSSVVGFAFSSAANWFLFQNPSHITVGASAAIMGLLGALVGYGRRTGSSVIGKEAWTYAVVLFLIGFLMARVDNWAHAGGFIGGYLGSLWLDPRKEERASHRLLAVLCLVLTAAAVIASLVIPA
ncbi:MAG TPA: rhomboid family intramembrane serine protease [Thermoanaerobaculia bacterium]|nr:rhomboid family intramembrane serine protease [Thermoanaerobaculia bacterium]